MNKDIVNNIIRFILLALFQVLILKRIELGGPDFNYIQILIYPLAILLLPLKTPKSLVVFLGFILGLTMDLFYDSPGIHASATVFMAYVRSFVLQILRPREGYDIHAIPSKYHFGLVWFSMYVGILLLLHLFFYFSVVLFTYYYFLEIWLRTISTFVFSFILIIIYQLLFNPVK